jgi:transposase
VLVTAPAALRDRLRHIPSERRAATCATLACPPGAGRLTRTVYLTLIRLGQRAVALTQVADSLEEQIATLVEDMAPGLVAAEYGLGHLTAAQLLLSWSHAGRIRTEAAFGMLSGTAPVPVSSGRTDRHRLNRLGDRQLNRALQIIAVSRMRSHPATRAYLQRRRAEGKTDREIRRCIKRYPARHLYRALNRLDTT